VSGFIFSRGTWAYVGIASISAVVGMVALTGFHTAMDATNSVEFCISCHEMRNTVYEEYKKSIHFQNAAGVRAVCSDCHVPRGGIAKMTAKMVAAKDVYHTFAGTIDTTEKFESKRLDLARVVWQRMKETDSRECRSCHSFEAMDHSKQRQKARERMQKAITENSTKEVKDTCIDCHKAIAHKRPDMTGLFRSMHTGLVEASAGVSPKSGDTIYTLELTNLSVEKPNGPIGPEAGRVVGGTAVKVLARDGDFVHVRISGWQQQNVPRMLYALQGKRIFSAVLSAGITDRVQLGQSMVDPDTGQGWTKGSIDAWISNKRLVADADRLWEYGEELFNATCSVCHSPPPKGHMSANEWIGALNNMKRDLSLDEEQYRFLQKYLQLHAKDVTGGH
jgi:trimethylamine-N-oxide reductase (cytochrome c), cytochrome c-type subunit TorC